MFECVSDTAVLTAKSKYFFMFKWIVSQDFGGLQMILMDSIEVPDVPLEVYFFYYFSSDSYLSFEQVKLSLIHLAKS